MGCRDRVCFVLVLCVGAIFAWGGAAAADPIEEALRQRIERLQLDGRLDIEGASVAAVEILPAVYEALQFRPAWTRPTDVQALIGNIEASADDGLNPSDFHLPVLKELLRKVPEQEPGARADLDLLLTDSLVRLAYQLRYGKVDAETGHADWRFNRPLLEQEPAQFIAGVLRDGRVAEALRALHPTHPLYERLKTALKYYRGLQAAGGWPTVPPGPSLEPGMEDERVTPLRKRLQASGDLKAGKETAIVYDDRLVAAVKRFQARSGLVGDGVVGAATLAALNTPVNVRVEQIRANLERARWVLNDLGQDFLAVNVASYSAALVHNGAPEWTARVIVGKPFRETPMFRSEITYLVVNPTWTVPPTIFREDLLPKLKRDPSYLARNNFDLVDRSGLKLSAAGIDWAGVSAKTFAYQIVQPPGKKNPLGRVKFMFPNSHQVYLHDTPDKGLFNQPARSFSSGCIRIEKPLELAEHLLARDPQWTKPAIEGLWQTTKTKTVHLHEPMPILLLYWTVEADADANGGVRFNPDIYDRDRQLAKALDERFRPVAHTASDAG